MTTRFLTLGHVDLSTAEAPLPALLAQPKRLALLAYLCMEAQHQTVRRSQLLSLFWPDSPLERARAALRQALHFLRKSVAPELFAPTGDDEVQLRAGAIDCDAARLLFEQTADPHLYRGDFLPGFTLPDSDDAFHSWLDGTRLRLRRQALSLLAQARQAAAQAGDAAAVRVLAERTLDLQPDDEAAARALMQVLAESGERSAALRVFNNLRKALAEQLDASPEAATLALAAQLQQAPTASPTGPHLALAILPLAGPGDAGLEYLCEGIADEMASRFHAHSGWRLAPRAVCVRAVQTGRDLASLRSGLDVDWVVSGQLRADGALLQIDLELIDLELGERCWQQGFALARGDLAALEQALLAALADASGQPLALPTGGGWPEPEALDTFLRGRYLWRRRPRDRQGALASLQLASARAPQFANAQAALADAYNTLGSWEAAEMAPQQAFPEARAAALAALCADPGCAAAHTALAYTTMHYEWQWDAAAQRFAQALALDPRYAQAHHWHAHYLMARGRGKEALAASLRALALDPLDPVINVHLAWHYWLAGAPQQALEQAQRSARLAPDEHWAPFFCSLALAAQGADSAAVDAARRALARCPDSPVMAAVLGYAYANAGDQRAALAWQSRLAPMAGHVGVAYEEAVIAHTLGQDEQALDLLDRAHQQKSAWLAYLAVDPRLAGLRRTARAQALLDALGLHDVWPCMH